MRIAVLALIAVPFAMAGCFTEPSPRKEPVTLYARKNGVVLRGAKKILRYGQALRFDWCTTATCFVEKDGVQLAVVRSDMLEVPPPSSPQFVVGVEGVNPATAFSVEAYNPSTGEVWIAGLRTPISAAHLQGHAETSEERAGRIKADAAERAERAAREREAAKQEKAAAREAAAEAKRQVAATAADRIAFAHQLRDNYLASGANVKVSVSKAFNTELRLEYPLIDDVWLYKFQHNDEVMSALRSKGFTSLVLSDGFDYAMRLRF